ncbi:MAG: hypothetical protein RID81_00180 [Sandaracinaceae bacterium]
MSRSEHDLGQAPSPALSEIAERVLGIATLEVRQSDALDFHEVGVASLRRALEDAFEAGARAASPAVRSPAAPTPGDPEAWGLYDRPGAAAAAGRLEAALAEAVALARRLYAEPEESLPVAAAHAYRKVLSPALRREAAFGTADGEPVDAAIDRFTRALAPSTDAVRFALEDAIHDAVFWRADEQPRTETR